MNLLEIKILDFISDVFKCAFLDKIMPIITMLGDHGIFWISVAVILLLIPKTRRIGIALGLSFILGGIVGNLILKNLFGRIRPYELKEGIELLVGKLSDFSFPSGHTLICFEAATVLMKKAPKGVGIVAVVSAVLVAFSRLYLYVHYPSDVVCGIILGIIFGILGCKLSDALWEKFKANE